jgi:hypothetical protein
MSSLLRIASWVIVDKITNKAIFETFSESIASKINVEKYQAVPVLEYLQNLNKQIRG